MVVEGTIQQVYDALQNLGRDCPLEETVALCPNLTWNQVFLAIDYLSRSGQICVMQDPTRTYRVQVLHPTISFSPAGSLAGVGSGNKDVCGV
jgi:hypothetical protein